MLFYCLPHCVFVLVPIVFAILPWASSRHVWSSLRSLDSPLFTSVPDNKLGSETPSAMTSTSSVDKRSGSDPWGICPRTMTRIDCFYRYLSLYAQLREDMREGSARNNRNIGKRGDTEFGMFQNPHDSRLEDGLREELPFLQSEETGLNKAFLQEEIGVKAPCPSDWTLLKCLMNGFSFSQSLDEK